MFIVDPGVEHRDDHTVTRQPGGVNLTGIDVAVACSDGLRGHVVGGHEQVLHLNHHHALEAP